MNDDVSTDISNLRQRVSLLEEDAKGEKTVSRHILRKVSENETAILDLRKEVSELRNDLTLLRADLPGIIAASIAPFFKK